jgi:ATP-dependent RNA helicase RhlE
MFTDFDLHRTLVRGLDELGFTEPTPIQRDAIPLALAGRDLLACATTGTGKTAAFLLPVLHRLITTPSRATRALVLTPTRELAAQIEAHFRQLAARTPLRAAAVFGGMPMPPQVRALRSGVDVLVATPGRLLDHLQQPHGRLDRLEFLVLDEADRMLDMGFLPDVRRILKHLPLERQTLLFSATMPREVAALGREMLRDPVAIDLQRRAAPAAGVSQSAYPVPQERKTDLLFELLSGDEIKNALVFTRTKHRASRLAATLDRRGVASAPIHGNRTQAQRTRALSAFRSGRVRVLVATDIAARGIDVEKLSHVVNFDVPSCSEDYIHRVGRTARARAVGDALTFVSPGEEADLRSIERALAQPLARVTLPGFDYSTRHHEDAPPTRSAHPRRRGDSLPRGGRPPRGEDASPRRSADAGDTPARNRPLPRRSPPPRARAARARSRASARW